MPDHTTPEDAAAAFDRTRELLDQAVAALADPAAAGLTHSELEDQVLRRTRELGRALLQDHLDLRAARETRRGHVADAEGVERTRAEPGHGRALATVVGTVTVTRTAYRAPGRENLHPADAELNLPEGRHSHGLGRLCALEATRGSFEAAAAAAERGTGVKVGKRQVEQLTTAAAADIADFYAQVERPTRPEAHHLVLTADARGIVMRPEALRPATARAAACAGHKLATRLSAGEKHGRKRICATRRSVISPVQPGGIRREVPGSDG